MQVTRSCQGQGLADKKSSIINRPLVHPAAAEPCVEQSGLWTFLGPRQPARAGPSHLSLFHSTLDTKPNHCPASVNITSILITDSIRKLLDLSSLFAHL